MNWANVFLVSATACAFVTILFWSTVARLENMGEGHLRDIGTKATIVAFLLTVVFGALAAGLS